MIPDIRRVQSQLEDAILADTEILEASANSLTEEQMCAAAQSLADKWAAKATADYKALGDYLLVKYMDGNQKHEDENGFKRTETGIGQYPMFPGYNERYYRSIVDDAGERLQIVEPKKR